MALALAEEFALVPTGPAAGKRLQLPFGKGQFYVPASAVELAARKISQVDSGTALGQLLYTKTPDRWHDFCHPKHLYKIKGKDGSTCIYTTFIVPGNDDESCLLRLVNSTVAEKNFKEWRVKFDEQIEKKTIVIRSVGTPTGIPGLTYSLSMTTAISKIRLTDDVTVPSTAARRRGVIEKLRNMFSQRPISFRIV